MLSLQLLTEPLLSLPPEAKCPPPPIELRFPRVFRWGDPGRAPTNGSVVAKGDRTGWHRKGASSGDPAEQAPEGGPFGRPREPFARPREPLRTGKGTPTGGSGAPSVGTGSHSVAKGPLPAAKGPLWGPLPVTKILFARLHRTPVILRTVEPTIALQFEISKSHELISSRCITQKHNHI